MLNQQKEDDLKMVRVKVINETNYDMADQKISLTKIGPEY